MKPAYGVLILFLLREAATAAVVRKPPAFSTPIYSDSYLPAAMQVILHAVDQLKALADTEASNSSSTTPSSTSQSPSSQPSTLTASVTVSSTSTSLEIHEEKSESSSTSSSVANIESTTEINLISQALINKGNQMIQTTHQTNQESAETNQETPETNYATPEANYEIPENAHATQETNHELDEVNQEGSLSSTESSSENSANVESSNLELTNLTNMESATSSGIIESTISSKVESTTVSKIAATTTESKKRGGKPCAGSANRKPSTTIKPVDEMEDSKKKQPTIDSIVEEIYEIVKPTSSSDVLADDTDESKTSSGMTAEKMENLEDELEETRFTLLGEKVAQVARPTLISYLKRTKVPLSTSLQQLAALYDALSKDARKQGYAKYTGYSDEVLKVLASSGEEGLGAQLKILLKKVIERNELTRDDARMKTSATIRDLSDDSSQLSKDLKTLIPLHYVSE